MTRNRGKTERSHCVSVTVIAYVSLLPPSLSYESRMEAAFFDSQTVCRLRGPHGRAPKSVPDSTNCPFCFAESRAATHMNSRRPKEILLFVSMRCEESVTDSSWNRRLSTTI